MMVSPTEYWSSMRMKMPVSMSLKMDWAPKLMPRPMTPAEAMKAAEGDAEGAEDLGEDVEADDGVGGGAEDGGHGAELGGALGVADDARRRAC